MFRRHFISFGVMLLALIVVLSACSDASNKVGGTTNENSVSDETKVVKDLFGEVTIPTQPQNLLVTSSIYAELLIEMGIIPKMVLITPEVEPDYRAPYFEKHGVQMIESDQYVYNFEQLLSVSPDLIISLGTGMEKNVYDELTKIAPTIALDANSEMENAMPKLADLFGKKAESDKLLADFDEKVKQGREKIEQAIGDKTVLVLRVESNRYRYLGSQAGNSSKFFYSTLGLHIPEVIKDTKEWFTPFSLEILPDMKPDYIFVEQRVLEGYDASQSMKDLEDSTVWKNLDAVKNGHVFPLKTNDFIHGVGPVGSVLLMDYVVEMLVQ